MEKTLSQLWTMLVDLFMAPGAAMMGSLAQTPWGQEWGAPAEPDWTIVAGVSLLFWCVVIALLGAMDDRIRAMLRRNDRRPRG